MTNSKLVEYLIKVLNDSQFLNVLKEEQVVRLKHDALRLLLALTEMNTKDDYIIQTLRKIIPLTVLINHFSSVYGQLVRMFGEEKYSRELFEERPTFILESGFNAYILYSIILDVKNVVEEQEDFNLDSNHILQDLLSDNLLNEITTFGKSLMEHGIEQFSQLKQQLQGEVQERIQIIQKHELIHKAMYFFK